ncbi:MULTISPECIES: hypothetical protein [unclassified Streptomyces]|uniref:hypothetical protein n=1 Tax=unclassified Streptomyces TaxID=2593676 RepID=UPI00136E68C8|nr:MULTISPECIES: hypothetical protein [unclassified Streptomyces]NDZ98533.1 hypothetical protein [Streptomyces sp. SID10116]MYY79741.1 hypothetical protein [Streptomyces sp. SID335]MYZ16555.1 hypothetical protein [Streptomyces sp. SID337]NDZ84522.1 hypothetical protein [Streptomyces sp. SID10115]NEB43485.1 hypothetical protein [Streptomyces sp. SID339]
MSPTLPSHWSVTWPLRPDGVHTVWVYAANPTHAVLVASKHPDLPVYAVAFDYVPEVWRLRHPRRRSYRAAGPDYGGAAGKADEFTPAPLDLTDVADEVRSTIQLAREQGRSPAELRAAVQPIIGNLLPSLQRRLLVAFAAEALGVAEYTSVDLSLTP